MMEAGLLVTVNSDDPAYFGGYLADNYRALVESFGLGVDELTQLAENSIVSSFLDQPDKTRLLGELAGVAPAAGLA
jgi:adenosine deaminase